MAWCPSPAKPWSCSGRASRSRPPAVSQLEADLRRLVDYFSSGQTERATKTARTLSKRYPGQPLPHNILGVLASNRGDDKGAIKHYRRALDLEPRYPDALNNLGAALQKTGQLQEAGRCYREVLRLAGHDAEVYFNLGNVLRALDNDQEAMTCFESAAALKPDNGAAYRELGQIHLRQRKLDSALRCFREVLDIDPTDKDAMCGIGRVLHERGRNRQALRWYQDALEIDSGYPSALLGAARVSMQLEQNEAAVGMLQRYMELVPGDPQAAHLLAAATGEATDLAPRSYIVSLFDEYSASFESHLVDALGYSGPRELARLLEDNTGSERHFQALLDLGCGSGLVGEELQEKCSRMTGVDLSPRMVEAAKEKGIYHKLVCGDIVEELPGLSSSYDLIISADTVIYIGNLARLAAAIAERADPGTYLLLSTEAGEQEGYQLLLSGRYAHHRDYVVETFTGVGFELREVRRRPLRKDRGEWLEGDFYLFEYRGTGA